MNFQPRYIKQPQNQIHWRGRAYTVAEAGALAVEEHARGNFQTVVDLYALMLMKMPASAELHNNRGAVLQKMDRWAEALASYDQAIALKPGYANAHYNRGSVLKRLNRYEEALTSYDQAIALKPDHVEAFHNRGVILANQGKLAAAEKMFLKAFDLKPNFPDPLFNLANLRKYKSTDNADVKKIHALLNQPGISADSKEQLYFSLGKIYDDCGSYNDAFECYRQANEIRNAQVAYDAAKVESLTSGIIEVFSQEFLAQPYDFASTSRTPLFILGMPRSGTTLLATILSNHRAIATAGELSTLPDFTTHASAWSDKGVPYPEAARHLTAAGAARMSELYEKQLGPAQRGNVTYVIDKNPINFRHIGLIRKLFPQAHIIHCTRHPLDTALSNYFQRFALNLDFSFDLKNIHHFQGQYVRLMDHWRQMPGLKMIQISYEDMVLHTEKIARQALDFLGLEWDERCLAPHTNTCTVETASQWQVRQPIYQHAIGRWRHYEKHLPASA